MACAQPRKTKIAPPAMKKNRATVQVYGLGTAANLAAGAPATCRRGLVARAPAGW